MSIQSEINRIEQNVADTYSVLAGAGAPMPASMDSDNLAGTAANIAAVLYNQAQSLTSEEQVQARLNIGATGQVSPEYASSLTWLEENGDTSKLYVLPDGYIYAYIYTETTVEPENEIPKSTADDRTTIFNSPKGYQLGLRINSSGVITSSSAPAQMGVTGFIPAKVGDVFEVRNYSSNSSYTSYIAAYDSSNNPTGKVTTNSGGPYAGLTDFDVVVDTATFGSNFNAIRISGDITDTTSVVNKSNSGVISGYKWTNTNLPFVPANYDGEINDLQVEIQKLNGEIETLNNKLENASKTKLAISEVFAPSPQLPADGSEGSDFNGDRDLITAEAIYEKIDEQLPLYPRFITKEIMGKDSSGTYDWCRYVCCQREYDAWVIPNYPAMYAWTNGSTTIYSVSVSPRIGDTLYTTPYIGTAKGTVTGVSNKNQYRTVDYVNYTRDKTKDVEPTLVYTKTTYSPYYVNTNAQYDNGIYSGSLSKISTIANIANGVLTGANEVSYTRYPLGDRNGNFKSIPSIVIAGNEHGTGGDPATPAIISARIIKDLCERKNMNNVMLNLLKNNYMIVFCPVVNPWGLNKDNQSYVNSNGVNIDRNFDTPGWHIDASAIGGSGEYGGSEIETQYFMNTLVDSKCKLAMCNHSLGEGIDYSTGEAANAGFCNFMFGRNNPKYDDDFKNIIEVMSANYNLIFFRGSEAPPENYAKTRSYIDWIGAEGGGLEMQSRDGFILDPNNEAQGKQFTAGVMEAAYTQLLQVLYMLIENQGG